MHEGLFRFDQLKQHLDQYNAPLFISIAEDVTRVIRGVKYDTGVWDLLYHQMKIVNQQLIDL